MRPGIFYIILFLILSGCFPDPIANDEKWTLTKFYGDSFCSVIVDSGYYQSNLIMENLLGRNDTVATITQVQLAPDGQFKIVKNRTTVLTGKWSYVNGKELLLYTNDQEWKFEISHRNFDSLSLNAGFYESIGNLHLTLTK